MPAKRLFFPRKTIASSATNYLYLHTGQSGTTGLELADFSGTAAAGSSNSITFPNTDPFNDWQDNAEPPVGFLVGITGGSAAPIPGQVRRIISYVNSTRVATVEPDWGTAPNSASTFIIFRQEPLMGGGIEDSATQHIALRTQVIAAITGTVTLTIETSPDKFTNTFVVPFDTVASTGAWTANAVSFATLATAGVYQFIIRVPLMPYTRLKLASTVSAGSLSVDGFSTAYPQTPFTVG